MSGFFGFDAVLPERRPAGDDTDPFGTGANEDIAVYTWGTEDYDDGLGKALMEGGDDLNDLTFGEGPIGNDFQFSHAPAQAAPATSKKAGTKSAKKRNEDLFASTEADFFAAPKKGLGRSRQKDAPSSISTKSAQYASTPTPPSQSPAPTTAQHSQPRVRTLQEIEAEMLAQSQRAASPGAGAGAPRPMTMEELERDMMQNLRVAPPQAPAPQQTAPGMPGPAPQSGFMGAQQQLQQEAVRPPLPSSHSQQSFMQPRQGQSMPPGPFALGAGPGATTPLAPAAVPAPGLAAGSMFPPLAPAQANLLGALNQPQAQPQSQQAPPMTEEQVTLEMERKIMETEMAEGKRRRKAQKIAGMARYNDIMTGGDKEFITRIQLSQLVTADPYESDFYAQVYSAIARAKLAAAGADPNVPGVLQVSKDGRGVGVGVVRDGPSRGAGRLRDNAMQRMTMQVKRIVDNAKNRGVKPANASLQGALGKTGTRSTAAAPRPALQVSSSQRAGGQSLTAMLGGAGSQDAGHMAPLTGKQVALRIEALYETCLDLEQTRRREPPPPPPPSALPEGQMPPELEHMIEQYRAWVADYEGQMDKLWKMLMVHVPIEACDPHPFISLMTPVKGHRIFGRLMRHIKESNQLLIVVLLVACFPQLDVIRNAPSPASLFAGGELSDAQKRTKQTQLRATESFLAGVIPVLVQLIGRLDLKMVAGLINVALGRWDATVALSTRPGIALFMILLSRAEMLKHVTAESVPGSKPPAPEEIELWNSTFLTLLRTILPKLPSIFPSAQAQAGAFGPAAYLLSGKLQSQGSEIGSKEDREGMMMDAMDGELWGLVAAMALHAPPEEQTALVSALRETILHAVQSAKKGWVSAPRAEMRVRNVNLFLNGLGLDATMLDV